MKNQNLLRVALITSLLAGCAGVRPQPYSSGLAEGRVITRAQIRATGGTTAWEALRRSGIFMSMSETPQGASLQLSRRGQTGSLHRTPLIVLDGLITRDIRVLADLQAHLVEEIKIFGGMAATVLYGAEAGNGAIVIRTRRSLV